jgi:hypothetical protein
MLPTAHVLVHSTLDVLLRPDGNSGYYAYQAGTSSAVVTGLSSNDMTLTGGFLCQMGSLGLAFFTGLISDQLGSAIAQPAETATEGESFCPLP